MKVAVVVFLSLLAIACATNWQVDSGYGVPTGVNTAPTPWNVLKFFPDNITVVQGDSISFTHRSDGHVIVFYSSVLNVIADFDNVYYDPTFLPTPPNKGLSVSDPVPILSNNVKYSSGIMVQAGQQWTASFPNTGTFFYFCLLHPGMVGFVNVLPSGSTAPQTQAAIDTQRVNAFAQINATAATLASVIKTVPVRTKRSDGTSVITVDNGYGDRNLAVGIHSDIIFVVVSLSLVVLSQYFWSERVLGICWRHHQSGDQRLCWWPHHRFRKRNCYFRGRLLLD